MTHIPLKERLIEIAEEARLVIETVIRDSEDSALELSDFPEGCCEFASVVLRERLKELGYTGVTLKSGARPCDDGNSKNHIWVSLDNKYILDITANQFDDCDQPVIVTEDSSYHDKFKVNENYVMDDTDFVERATQQMFFDVDYRLSKLKAKTP